MSSASWWAKRWEVLMQEWGISVAEARNNRAYRVKSLEVVPGGMNASIHDRDAGACKVEVRVPTLSDKQWEQIGDALGNQPLVASQLLSGAMAPEIEQLFAEVGAHLLPTSFDEIATTCTICADNKCRHLPLVFSLFAEMLGNDPGLLFTLRGRELQQFMRDVREARAGGAAMQAPANGNGSNHSGHANGAGRDANSNGNGANHHDAHAQHLADDQSTAPASTPSLAAEIDTYWGNRALMRQFHHHIAPPTVELSLLRRLGPISASDDSMAVYEQLVALYRRITEEALALAYASDDDTPAN